MHVGTPATVMGTLRSRMRTDCVPVTVTRLVSPVASWSSTGCGVRPSWWSVAASATEGTATAAVMATAAARGMRDMRSLLGEGRGGEGWGGQVAQGTTRYKRGGVVVDGRRGACGGGGAPNAPALERSTTGGMPATMGM